MLSKIGQHTETVGLNKLVEKTFQRGLQTIQTKSAYINDKLYFRSWDISQYGKRILRKQSYLSGHPIKGMATKLDITI